MQLSLENLVCRASQRLWGASHFVKARLQPAPAQRILFSARDDWEGSLREGFKATRHELEFKPLDEALPGEYDFVVPLTTSDVVWLADHPEFAGASRLPSPSREVVDLCDDKLLLNRQLNKLGFGDHIPRMGRHSGSPFMIKKRVDENGQSCRIDGAVAPSGDQLARHGENELIQEFVVGPIEHAYHVLFQNGRIQWGLNVEYRFGTDRPIKGQDSPQLQIVTRPRHVELWTRILRAINYQGLCCINFKDSPRGPQLLEINPRCGGSLTRHFYQLVDHLCR